MIAPIYDQTKSSKGSFSVIVRVGHSHRSTIELTNEIVKWNNGVIVGGGSFSTIDKWVILNDFYHTQSDLRKIANLLL